MVHLNLPDHPEPVNLAISAPNHCAPGDLAGEQVPFALHDEDAGDFTQRS
jgi:hypothetical protein